MSESSSRAVPDEGAASPRGQLLGYARVSTTHQTNDPQTDALLAIGVDPDHLYVDKLTGTSKREDRPGMKALIDYARPGDVIVVTAVDRLGRTAIEVMLTVRDLLAKDIVIRALNAGVDSSSVIGRTVFTILASFAELELELGKERREAARTARKARGLPIGRPKALPPDKIALAERMRASGEAVPEIAKVLGVSRATLYRTLAERGE